MKKLAIALECPKRAVFTDILKEDITKKKPVLFKKCLREAFKAGYDLKDLGDKNIFKTLFKDYLNSLFMEKQREEIVERLTENLKTLYAYICLEKLDIIGYEVKTYSQRYGLENNQIFDMVAKSKIGDDYYYFSIGDSQKKYAVSSKAQTSINNDIKVYLKYLSLIDSNPHKIQSNHIFPVEVSLGLECPKKPYQFINVFHVEHADETAMKSQLMQAALIDWDKPEKTDNSSSCMFCSYKNLCKGKLYEENVIVKKVEEKEQETKTPKFTSNQNKFINDHSGIIRVIASAGSGKTTCIVNRFLSIVKNGEDPTKILLITFTQKGVQEMKAKLKFWLNKNGVDIDERALSIYTFNSFGDKIVKDNYLACGFSEEPRLIDYLEKLSILKDIVDSEERVDGLNYVNPLANVFKAKGAVLAISQMISDYYNKKLELKDVVEKEKIIKRIAHKYKEELKQHNLIDYDDQVRLASELLKDEKIANRYDFEHIVVDEAQDTSEEQFSILDSLMEHNGFKSYVLCGDDAQSIYSFRGVNMDYLVKFHTIKPNVKDYRLLNNFRSTYEIVEVANSVSERIQDIIPRMMFADKDGIEPKIIQVDDKYRNKKAEVIKEEAKEIAYNVWSRYFLGDYSVKDMAVIARSKSSLEEVAKYLKEKGVPYKIVSPEKYVDSFEVLAVKSLLSIILGENDILDNAQFMKCFYNEEYNSSYDLTLDCQIKATIIKEALEGKSEEEKKEYFFHIIQQKGYVPSLKSLFELFEEKEINTLEKMYQYLDKLFEYNGDDSYVDEKAGIDAVTLITAHSSKGKEWKYVGIVFEGLCKINPFTTAHIKSYKNSAEENENLRLLFVAITRAMEYLVIAC